MGDRHVIGSFQPFAELCRGPATTVYKAYDPSARRFVLLKVLRPALAREAEAVHRFTTEADLAGRIDHPNVVRIYDFGAEDETVYLAAEFVDGPDLAAVIARGALPWELAAWIAGEMAQGLAAAHDWGILHRDLKPSNVLLSNDGRVKLTDFGMASLAEADEGAEEVRGTMPYLAPEQVLGEPPGPASDLFALGATLYEMLVGHPAFRGADAAALLDAIVHYDPMPRLAAVSTVPEALKDLTGRLLAKAPEARPPSAHAVAAALADLLDGLPVDAERLALFLEDPAAYRSSTPPLVPTPPPAPPAIVASPPLRAAGEAAGREEAGRRFRGRRWSAAVLVMAVLLAGAVWWQTRTEPAVNEPAATVPGPLARHSPVPADTAAASGATALDGDADDGGEAAAEAVAAEDGTPPAPMPLADGAAGPATARDTTATRDTTAAPPAAGERLAAGEPPAAEPAPGQVRVAATPWAAVYVGDDSIGVTTTTLTLPAGSHELVLRHPQFPPYTHTVLVRPDSVVDVTVSLWATVGRLTLDVQPWAEVYVDDEYRDTVPPQERPLILTPGRHTLRLVHPTLGAWETTLEVEAGVSETRRFDLTTLLARR